MQFERFTVSRSKINFVEVSSATLKIHVAGYPSQLVMMGPAHKAWLDLLEKEDYHKIGPHFVNADRLSVVEERSTNVYLYFDGGDVPMAVPAEMYREHPVPTSDHKRKK